MVQCSKKAWYIGCIFFISFFLPAFSQKETWKWYISGSPPPALDFSSGTPVSLANNGMVLSWEGCATISDANGNLLYYADGDRRVYNRNHVTMPNGNNVYMQNSVTQGGLFIQKPGSSTIMYFFYIGVPVISGGFPWNLYYSEIDRTLNGGLGDINANKNISLAPSFGNCSEKMAAVKQCNGTDYWLVVHSYYGNTFFAYPVTATGVGAPVISSVGTPHASTASEDAIGQMKISPNGNKLALVVNDAAYAEVFDFNKNTGAVSNPINLGSIGQYAYGLEFSPDNSKLYASNSGTPAVLRQWDLCAGSPAAVIASGTNIPLGTGGVYSLQLASDGKIYGTRFTSQMAAINNPNVAGTGCNYSANGVSIAPQNSSLGLPGFVSSFFDTPAGASQASVAAVNSGSCGCTGSATASICTVFGTAPYTYTWSNATVTGPTTNLTAAISGLCTGTYSVVVNDAACESDTVVFTISGSGNSFTVTPTSAPAACGNSNGSASVSVSGGTAPYAYVWSPAGGSSSSATGLSAGNYTVTITDAASCISASVITISSTSTTSVSITSQNVICNGAGNGTATASMNGGTSPFTYIWSNGQTLQAATGLAPGTYTCTVTDAAGCSASQTVSITQPTALTANILSSMTSCGQSTGVATVVANGGIAPYSYQWSNGQTASTATALAAGTYSCTITDAGGCTQVATTVIMNLNGPIGTINSQAPPSCNGGNNGTASASVLSGGTAPYTFVWSNGQTGATVSGLSAGNYTVTVTDAGGCSNTQTVTISQPPPITANVTNTPASCGMNDGTAFVSVSAGNSPYTYIWSPPGGNSQSASGLAPGNYTVLITDAKGCTQTAVTTVASLPGPMASAGAGVTILAGSSATLNAAGGITYSWNPASGLDDPLSASPVASPTATIMYCVKVVDAGGCSDSACVTVYVIPEPVPCGSFYIPNAFSPNDDNENDAFRTYINPACVQEYKLVIYNRWGEKVFYTEDVNEGWNGLSRGQISDPAVYAYYCRALLVNGEKVSRKGNVSLLR